VSRGGYFRYIHLTITSNAFVEDVFNPTYSIEVNMGNDGFSAYVVEMISELPDPQNAWGKAVKLYIPAISYISICKGPFSPIRAERELIKAEYTRSELNS
jgi:hypothetical protein